MDCRRWFFLLCMGLCATGIAACETGDQRARRDATPLAGGASTNRNRAPIVVFAAASLEAVFDEAASRFAARPDGTEVVIHAAGSQILATQLLEGARADLFASADAHQLDRVRDVGLFVAGTPFATNSLVVVTPLDNPGHVQTPIDLARPGLRLVLAGPDVPAGAYAREALQRLGIAGAVDAGRVSEESDVRGVLAKVALGEADAGIVYRTDLGSALADTVRTIPLPAAADVRATYWIARSSDTPRSVAADGFTAWLLSTEGRSLLAEHGFSSP